MKVKVFVDRKGINKSLNVSNMKEIFQKLDINPEEYILVREGRLITAEEKIKEGDELKFLSVVSGG